MLLSVCVAVFLSVISAKSYDFPPSAGRSGKFKKCSVIPANHNATNENNKVSEPITSHRFHYYHVIAF